MKRKLHLLISLYMIPFYPAASKKRSAVDEAGKREGQVHARVWHTSDKTSSRLSRELGEEGKTGGIAAVLTLRAPIFATRRIASGRASKRDRMPAPVRKIRLRMRAGRQRHPRKNPFRTKQYDVCSPEELLPEIYEAPGFPRADLARGESTDEWNRMENAELPHSRFRELNPRARSLLSLFKSYLLHRNLFLTLFLVLFSCEDNAYSSGIREKVHIPRHR